MYYRNALCLDGTCGTTVIESQGQARRFVFVMDPVRREPRILPETVPPIYKTAPASRSAGPKPHAI
jgi:hypothetical protein